MKPFLTIMALVLMMQAFPPAAAGQTGPAGKTVLWLDSYHQGYEWTDGIERGIRAVLDDTGVILRIHRMDTKRHREEAFKVATGKNAAAEIKRLKPDLVIASDDNAQQYVIVPYFKNAGLPVVFCGVNWDASVYGYPCANVTGMVEVEPIETLMWHLKRYAGGERTGLIGGNTPSILKVVNAYNAHFFETPLKTYLMNDFKAFKAAFVRSQAENDMVIFYNHAGIDGWSGEAAEPFIAAQTRKPTGSPLDYMAPFVMFTVGKLPEEQGEYAARAALRILAGENPAAIPLAQNEKSVLTVNLKMTEAVGLVIPVATLRAAKVIGKEAME